MAEYREFAEGDKITVGKVIEAVYEKGVFRPKKPIALEEGQIVRIILPEVIQTSYIGQIDKRLRQHFGAWSSGNPNFANNDSIDNDLESEYASSNERES